MLSLDYFISSSSKGACFNLCVVSFYMLYVMVILFFVAINLCVSTKLVCSRLIVPVCILKIRCFVKVVIGHYSM